MPFCSGWSSGRGENGTVVSPRNPRPPPSASAIVRRRLLIVLGSAFLTSRSNDGDRSRQPRSGGRRSCVRGGHNARRTRAALVGGSARPGNRQRAGPAARHISRRRDVWEWNGCHVDVLVGAAEIVSWRGSRRRRPRAGASLRVIDRRRLTQGTYFDAASCRICRRVRVSPGCSMPLRRSSSRIDSMSGAWAWAPPRVSAAGVRPGPTRQWRSANSTSRADLGQPTSSRSFPI